MHEPKVLSGNHGEDSGLDESQLSLGNEELFGADTTFSSSSSQPNEEFNSAVPQADDFKGIFLLEPEPDWVLQQQPEDDPEAILRQKLSEVSGSFVVLCCVCCLVVFVLKLNWEQTD